MDSDATDVDEEEDAVHDSIIATNLPEMRFSEQDLETRIKREKEKAKTRWRRQKQSILAKMTILQGRNDELEKSSIKHTSTCEQIYSKVDETESSTTAIAQEKDSEIYELVSKRERLKATIASQQQEIVVVMDKIQAQRDRLNVQHSDYQKREAKIKQDYNENKQKILQETMQYQKQITEIISARPKLEQDLVLAKKFTEEVRDRHESIQEQVNCTKKRIATEESEMNLHKSNTQNELLELKKQATNIFAKHKQSKAELEKLEPEKTRWILVEKNLEKEHSNAIACTTKTKEELSALREAKKNCSSQPLPM